MQFNLCFVWKAEMEWNCETDEGWVANFKEHGQQRGKARRHSRLESGQMDGCGGKAKNVRVRTYATCDLGICMQERPSVIRFLGEE